MPQLHQNKGATFLGSSPRDLSKHVQNKTLLFGRFRSRCRPCCPSCRHSSRFGCLPTAPAAAPNAARNIAFRTPSQTTIFISDRPCRESPRTRQREVQASIWSCSQAAAHGAKTRAPADSFSRSRAGQPRHLTRTFPVILVVPVVRATSVPARTPPIGTTPSTSLSTFATKTKDS